MAAAKNSGARGEEESRQAGAMLVYVFLSLTSFLLSYPVLGKGDGSNGDWGSGSGWWDHNSCSWGVRGEGQVGKVGIACILNPLNSLSGLAMLLSLLRTQYCQASGLLGPAPDLTSTALHCQTPISKPLPSFYPRSEGSLGRSLSL